MKKKIFSLVLVAVMALLSLTSCGKGGGQISVVSREEGSGTRGAFIELFGVEEKDADGNKVDKTTENAEITNSTAVMMTTVAGNTSAIGYISLGSLNDTVKALKIDGVEASVANVENGSYKISRPFNIVTKDKISEVAQDFIDFILSAEGQQIVEKEKYISVGDKKAYTSKNLSGKVMVSGSSSVTPVMEKLKEAYCKLNSGVQIELQQSDSSTGIKDAQNGVSDIGMASRELKSEETGVTPTVIAKDGIAVIVNNDSEIDDLSTDTVKSIFTGKVTDWSEIENGK